MKKLLMLLLPFLSGIAVGAIPGIESVESGLITMTSLPEGAELSEYVQVDLPLLGAETVQLTLDGEALFSSEENLKTIWKPRALGEHTLVYTAGEKSITRMVKVVDLVKYAVTATIVGEGVVAGLDDYMSDTEVTLTATPNEGSVFCGWDVASATTDTHTFTMPEEAVNVTAYFASATALDKYVAREKLLTPAQANQQTQDYIADNKLKTPEEVEAAIEASISQKVADGELLTPAGAATQTEKVINQKVADGELITSDQLQVMAMEAPVIAVEDGVAKVGVSLKRAASLEGEWEQVEAEEAEITDEGAISVSVPAGEKAAFYKFVVPNEQ